MYKYLITSDCMEPFLTNYFDIENNFNSEINMVVFDIVNNLYFMGSDWQPIKEDHL